MAKQNKVEGYNPGKTWEAINEGDLWKVNFEVNKETLKAQIKTLECSILDLEQRAADLINLREKLLKEIS